MTSKSALHVLLIAACLLGCGTAHASEPVILSGDDSIVGPNGAVYQMSPGQAPAAETGSTPGAGRYRSSPDVNGPAAGSFASRAYKGSTRIGYYNHSNLRYNIRRLPESARPKS